MQSMWPIESACQRSDGKMKSDRRTAMLRRVYDGVSDRRQTGERQGSANGLEYMLRLTRKKCLWTFYKRWFSTKYRDEVSLLANIL